MQLLGILLVATIVMFLIGLNVYACVVIAGSEAIPSRKWAQGLFVWLVPVIGGIVAVAAHKPSTTAAPLEDVGADEGIRMPGQLSNYDH